MRAPHDDTGAASRRTDADRPLSPSLSPVTSCYGAIRRPFPPVVSDSPLSLSLSLSLSPPLLPLLQAMGHGREGQGHGCKGSRGADAHGFTGCRVRVTHGHEWSAQIRVSAVAVAVARGRGRDRRGQEDGCWRNGDAGGAFTRGATGTSVRVLRCLCSCVRKPKGVLHGFGKCGSPRARATRAGDAWWWQQGCGCGGCGGEHVALGTRAGKRNAAHAASIPAALGARVHARGRTPCRPVPPLPSVTNITRWWADHALLQCHFAVQATECNMAAHATGAGAGSSSSLTVVDRLVGSWQQHLASGALPEQDTAWTTTTTLLVTSMWCTKTSPCEISAPGGIVGGTKNAQVAEQQCRALPCVAMHTRSTQ